MADPKPDANATLSGAAQLAQKIEQIVIHRIASDQLVLPSIPAVALKCLRLLRNPEFSIREATSIIERDPMLTAQLIRVCNTAAVATREPVRSVLQAVSRLGVNKLRNFLFEVSARTVFESRDKRIAEAFRGLWEHSVAVAILGRDIVAFANAGDPEFGYLGGLLHDIGKPIVAAMLLEAEKAVVGGRLTGSWLEPNDWLQAVHRVHRRVGVALAERWELPAEVCKSIRNCEEYDTSERVSVSNAVLFANALAKQQGIYVGDLDISDATGQVMVGRSLLNLDDNIINRLTTSLRATLRDQMQ